MADVTAAARVGGFPLLAMPVYAADEYPASYTGARAPEAGVVCLYGVVMVLGRWVRMGCARLSLLSTVACQPFCGPGSEVLPHLRGHFRYGAYILTRLPTDVYKCGTIFLVNYLSMEVNLEKLRQMRIDQGLSQRQLSLKAGLSAGAVAVVEQRGRAHPDTLKKIADLLGVRASELIKE